MILAVATPCLPQSLTHFQVNEMGKSHTLEVIKVLWECNRRVYVYGNVLRYIGNVRVSIG